MDQLKKLVPKGYNMDEFRALEDLQIDDDNVQALQNPANSSAYEIDGLEHMKLKKRSESAATKIDKPHLFQSHSIKQSVPCATELEDAGVEFKKNKKAEIVVHLCTAEAESFVHLCATELEDAGLEFKKNKKAESFLDVQFGNAVMRIPQLPLHDETNMLFRNLVAFEQCCPDADDYVTCYAVFMGRIIDTPSDVALLQRKGVIVNILGSDEDAAVLFNKLWKGVVFYPESSHLAELFCLTGRSPPVRRRDDLLLELPDGIQSATAHCKRSFNAGSESPLLRSRR